MLDYRFVFIGCFGSLLAVNLVLYFYRIVRKRRGKQN